MWRGASSKSRNYVIKVPNQLYFIWPGIEMGWADVQRAVVLLRAVRWQHRTRGVSPLPERRWAGAWDPPTSWRMTRHSSAACPALRREEAEVSSARPRTEAWLYSHLNRTDCSFSISRQNPRRRHAYPKEDEQEPARDEPRVYHPESCRHCFLCCYGVPPGVDVWGKFFALHFMAFNRAYWWWCSWRRQTCWWGNGVSNSHNQSMNTNKPIWSILHISSICVRKFCWKRRPNASFYLGYCRCTDLHFIHFDHHNMETSRYFYLIASMLYSVIQSTQAQALRLFKRETLSRA